MGHSNKADKFRVLANLIEDEDYLNNIIKNSTIRIMIDSKLGKRNILIRNTKIATNIISMISVSIELQIESLKEEI